MLYMTKKYRDTLTDEQFASLLAFHRGAPDFIHSFYCDAEDEDGYANMMSKYYLDNCLRKENKNRRKAGLSDWNASEYFAECERRGVQVASELKRFLDSDCGVITCDLAVMT